MAVPAKSLSAPRRLIEPSARALARSSKARLVVCWLTCCPHSPKGGTLGDYTKYVCIMTHYAKDDKAYAAPEFRAVGEPLPQSPRSSLTQPLPDPLAHQRR